MKAEEYELGDRVLQAFAEENIGNIYKRQHIISDRWLDGAMELVDELEKEKYEKQTGRAG